MIVDSYLTRILVVFFVVFSFEVNSKIYEKKNLFVRMKLDLLLNFTYRNLKKIKIKKIYFLNFFTATIEIYFIMKVVLYLKNLVPLITPTFITKWIRF